MTQAQQKLKIDHYIIEKTIGEGGFGKVKLARHEFTGSEVAIKIINKNLVKQKKMSSKIQREIRLLKYFDHPNMIRLYQVLDTTQNIFVVMEYVSGGELFSLVKKEKGLSEDKARLLFRQIIDGVQYCHQNLVAHRDLKLENILVDKTGLIKIADFGLSNFMKDGHFLKTSCGSLHYAPPEIIQAKPYTGVEVDTWSCGVILYAMITAGLPFDHDTVANLMELICKGEFNIPDSVSPEAADLIRRMLRVNPLERISLSDIKRHKWFTGSDLPEMVLRDTRGKEESSRVNEELLNQLLAYDFDFQNLSLDDVTDAIRLKKNYSFVIGYQLLKDSADRELRNQNQDPNNAHFFGPLKDTVEAEIDNLGSLYMDVINRKDKSVQGNWKYGLTFEVDAKECINCLMEVLTKFRITYIIKSTTFHLRCTYDLNKEVGSSRDMVEEEDAPKEEVILFTTQIYKINPNLHMIDIKRSEGGVIMFLDLVSKIKNELCKKMSLAF